MIASCDPATGAWWPTVDEQPSQGSLSYAPAGTSPLPASSAPREFEELKDKLLRCGEFMFEPGGPLGPSSGPGEPRPTEDGRWGPRTPPSRFTTFLVRTGRNTLATIEYLGVDLGVTITEHGDIVSKDAIQSVEWVVPKYVPHPVPGLRRQVRQDVQLSAARTQEPERGSPPTPPSDPSARCS
jgi:hypothetical protein